MEVVTRFIRDIPIYVLVMFLTITLFIAVAISLPPPHEIIDTLNKTAERLREIANNRNLEQIITGIFLNNAYVNTLMATPFISLIIYPSVVIVTAWTLRVGVPLEALPTAIILLLLSPHTYIEMFAYSISFTSSIRTMIRIIKSIKSSNALNKEHLLYYLFSIAVSFVVLFIAAVVEGISILIFRP
jgi:uncharacterized membrane protein SpoIIM required for sporulation